MAKKKCNDRAPKKPFVAVMLPFIPEKVLSLANESLKGVMQREVNDAQTHATSTRKYQLRNIGRTSELYQNILHLGATEGHHSLTLILERLKNPEATLLITGHGSPDGIGTHHFYAEKPQNIAEKFARLVAAEIRPNLQCHIKLYVCNSGTEVDGQPCYAKRLFDAMKTSGFTGISTSGYIGFMGEISKNIKHTYVTTVEHADVSNKSVRLHRAEESMITFHANGEVTQPKKKLRPMLHSASHIEQLALQRLQQEEVENIRN